MCLLLVGKDLEMKCVYKISEDFERRIGFYSNYGQVQKYAVTPVH